MVDDPVERILLGSGDIGHLWEIDGRGWLDPSRAAVDVVDLPFSIRRQIISFHSETRPGWNPVAKWVDR